MISDEFGFDLFFTVKAALLAEMEEVAALDPFLRAGCPGEEGRYAGLCLKHKNWCGDKKKIFGQVKELLCPNQQCIMEKSLCWRGRNRKRLVFLLNVGCLSGQENYSFRSTGPNFCIVRLHYGLSCSKEKFCLVPKFSALWKILIKTHAT